MAAKARSSSVSRPPARRKVAARGAKSAGSKPIAAVERALQVLGAFRGAPRQTLSELSQRTGLFKSTLLRILSTLERHGYVIRLADGRYRLGGLLLELGAGYLASFDLAEVVRPALAALAQQTGESASFYVRAGSRRQCLFRVDSAQAVRHVINAGQIVDLDGAATSQLLRRHDGDTARPPAALDYAGLCLATSGIGDTQTASVAAPVFNTEGFVGVINVSGPVGRFTPRSTAAFRAALAEAARRVTASLGGFEG